jgi:DNA-binding beta-propeller fold protein YncE
VNEQVACRVRSKEFNVNTVSKRFSASRLALALLVLTAFAPQLCRAQIMVVGIDRKFAYDENAVRQALVPGHDEVLFYDIQNPMVPKLLGSLPLENSIIGPPTNVAVTPDGSIALIANAVHSEKTEAGWKAVPADEVFVVDLKSSPPRLAQTLKVGRQPSGLAISNDGSFALVANRDDKSVTMLRIDSTTVSVGDTVAMEDSIGAIAIAPDGRRAIATRTTGHKVVLMKIGPDRKLNVEANLWTGLFPWNVAIAPDGRTALVNNIGNNGQSDGGAKTVSVIDLATAVPFVSQQISVGDAPEGVVFSPNGAYAAITILQGSYDAPATAWFRHDGGAVTLLKIAGDKTRAFSSEVGTGSREENASKQKTRAPFRFDRNGKGSILVNSVDVGAFPEGLAFAPDNQHLYVGNFHSNSISILKIDASGHLADTGRIIRLSGPPASLRIGSQ